MFKNMPVVALEEHYWDKELSEKSAGFESARSEWQMKRLFDFDELRLGEMDANGIDVQVISHGAPSIQRMKGQKAVAELRNLSGRDVMLGLVIGYDVHIKIRDASERRGFDMPSIEAQYGSAAAAARLMGQTPKQIANTLSIAASTANTLSEVRAGDTLTNAKGTAEALAVRAGTFAALLSTAGIDYPPTMMDGEFSYKALVSRGLKEEVLRKRTGDFEVMKSSMKMWPSIGTSQAPIAAALQFRARGIKAADIRSVTRVDSNVAVSITRHVAVRNDSATVNKLLPDAHIISAKKSIACFLKLEPLIANRSDSAAIGDSLNRFDLTRPSDATTDRVDRETSVRTGPQTLVKQSAAGLIDVVVDTCVIDANADSPSNR